jgi:hypothetical protein
LTQVIFTKVAEREIKAAAKFFESRKEGFGEKFYRRVDEAAERIELNHEGYMPVYRDARRVQLRQFPEWFLWFRIRDEGALVIACLSGKRHPTLAKERSSSVIEIKPKDPASG